jgi:hypothetical protein
MTKLLREMPPQIHVVEQRLKAIARTSATLAYQIAELHELRRTVQQAQLPEQCVKQPSKGQTARPGRLFMRNRWMMGQSFASGGTASRWVA